MSLPTPHFSVQLVRQTWGVSSPNVLSAAGWLAKAAVLNAEGWGGCDLVEVGGVFKKLLHLRDQVSSKGQKTHFVCVLVIKWFESYWQK